MGLMKIWNMNIVGVKMLNADYVRICEAIAKKYELTKPDCSRDGELWSLRDDKKNAELSISRYESVLIDWITSHSEIVLVKKPGEPRVRERGDFWSCFNVDGVSLRNDNITMTQRIYIDNDGKVNKEAMTDDETIIKNFFDMVVEIIAEKVLKLEDGDEKVSHELTSKIKLSAGEMQYISGDDLDILCQCPIQR
jgi:hypothetical protein